MLEADLDGNGTIEFPEFLELMKEKYGSDDQESDLRSDLISLLCSDANLREAFKIFDRDRDGFIDMRELKKVSLIPVTFCSNVFLLSPFLNHVKIGKYLLPIPMSPSVCWYIQSGNLKKIAPLQCHYLCDWRFISPFWQLCMIRYSTFGGVHDVGHLP